MTYVRRLAGGLFEVGGDVKSGKIRESMNPTNILYINISGIARKSMVVMIGLQLSRGLLSM